MKYHSVPRGFKFPTTGTNLKLMCQLWCLGHDAYGVTNDEGTVYYKICPYRHLIEELSSADRKYYSKAFKVIKRLFKDRIDVTALTSTELFNEHFEPAFVALIDQISIVCRNMDWRRAEDLTYTTLANNIYAADKKIKVAAAAAAAAGVVAAP